MKRKILSTLLTLVLVCSFSLIPAVPAGAATTAEQELAIIAAADRLVGVQNEDGGFPWKAPPEGASTTNCQGVTAMGIMEAWKIEAKPAYVTALALAYKFVVDKEPVFAWVDGKYTENVAPGVKGVDSFPDVTFLIELAEAADEDATLLTAINDLQDPDITAVDIAALAQERWDGRVNHLGAAIENDPNPTAAAMAKYIRTIRHPDYDAILPWDLESAIQAALALDSVYSGQDYDQQALDIAGVVYDSVDDVAETYFSSTDDTQNDYILGLAGAILAYEQLGLYPTEVAAYRDLLIANQQPSGYWNYHGTTPAEKGVQSTAYAALALFKEGTANARTAANKATNWLVSSQRAGGWYEDVAPECASTVECYEVNGEAAWALAVIGAVSVELNEDWYETLGTVHVTVEDAAATDWVRVNAISDFDVAGTTATLTETGAGVFEGSFLLVPPPVPDPPNLGELVVEDGNLITVTYLGVTDTARIDDTPPGISSVSPADGALVPDATPLISATLADDASGINEDTIVMTVDGNTVDTAYANGIASYTPADVLAQGSHTVTVDVDDIAGNAATQASWSFTVDTLSPGVGDIHLRPDQPYTEVGDINFLVGFDEPMDTSVLPTLTFGLLAPFDIHPVANIVWSTDEGVWWWGGRFTIAAPWGLALDGEQTLSISGAQDLAGNVMLTDTSTHFVIDLNVPVQPEYLLAFVNQNPPRTADSVEGLAGAVEGGALVEVWAEVGLTNLIGFIEAHGDGRFDPIPIGDNQYSTVWVTAKDAVGHRSNATELYNDIAGPLITSGNWFVNAEQPAWVREGQVIDVVITGEPGCTATFDIGEIAVGFSATETPLQSGTYTGNYLVAAGDDAARTDMGYYLTDEVGNTCSLWKGGPSIDTIVPTIDSLTPADGAYVDTATPKISAVLDDNLSGVDQASIVMTVDGAGVTPVYADGVVSYTPDSDLTEGSHAVTLDVSDVAGNPATQASWSFTVDTIDPIITIDPVTTPTDVELQEIKGTFAEVNLVDGITLTFNGHSQLVNISEPNWNVLTLVHLQQGDNLIEATITDLAGNSASAEATVNLDTRAPVVTVTSPNGGESWLGGNMYNITWTALDANFITSPITIKYSVDSGKSWNAVATSEVNDGGYLWAVPKLDSSDCQVRVTGADSLGKSGSDVSDAVFTITTSAPDAIAPAVTVNSPNGGEIWQGGSPRTITWTATDDKTPSASLLVDLYFSLNGGTNWTSIATSQVNNGAYSWLVPEANSGQCLVRVEASDTSGNVGFDISNTVFTITTPGEPAAPVETIELKTGWNLVSLMLIPTNPNITEVLGDIPVISVWAYDASIEDPAERWSSYTLGAPPDLETMVDGKGYWIEMGSLATLTIVGEELPVPPDLEMPAYSVVEGWNLIGFKSTTPKVADSYLLAIDGKYTLVRGYDGSYFTVGAGQNLDPGSGYWIAITESGTIYP